MKYALKLAVVIVAILCVSYAITKSIARDAKRDPVAPIHATNRVYQFNRDIGMKPKWLVSPALGSEIAFTIKPTCPVFTNGVWIIRFTE